jgi:flavin-dependent dehydrogenase
MFLRPRGVLVRQLGAEQLILFGEDKDGQWQGFQAPRQVLDSLLLARAESLGAELQLQSRALGLLFDQGHVAGVSTDKGDVPGRFVVDCGGGGHWIGRKLDIAVRRYSPRLFARFGYLKGTAERIRENPLMDFDNNGWTWLSQVQEDLLHWTRLDVIPTPLRQHSRSNRIPACVRHSAHQFAGISELIEVSSSRGADVTWRILKEPAGPSYFAAGDAAAVIDPASSHGVLKAVMSGIYVGHLIARVISQPAIQPIVTAEYARWLYAWFLNDTGVLARRYNQTFPGWALRDC